MSNLNTAVNTLLADNENFKFVACTFPGSTKQYHYKTMLDVQDGDNVIIPANGTFKVVQVVEVIDYMDFDEGEFSYLWVVQIVDSSAYEKALELEAEVVKLLRHDQRKTLRKAAIEAINGSGATIKQIQKLVRL